MPEVIEWLRAQVGFNLPQPDVQAILDFALLYSLFEAKALNEDGSPVRIIEAVERWHAAQRLQLEPFQASYDYFKDRYFPGGQEGPRFAELNLSAVHRPRVALALSDPNATPMAAVTAVLLIVNRLRNNLMHGPKWAYGLVGQGDNFRNANLALMAALDCNGGYG